MNIETLLAQAGSDWDNRTGAVSMPIYQSAVYKHPALGRSTGYDYTRTSNPTRFVLEELFAKLEGAAGACAFSSGMAAVDAVLRVLLHFYPPSAQKKIRVIVTEDLYGGTFRLIEHFFPYIEADYTDTSSREAVLERCAKPFSAIFAEIPTNPLLKVCDIGFLAELSHKNGAKLIIDNTFLTPINLRPLELGADISVYSGTKYLGGHNDVLAGFAAAKDAEVSERLKFTQNAAGAVLNPFESWLLLRSLKSLSVRLEKQTDNAEKIAGLLKAHPAVAKVYYPALADDPGRALLAAQSKRAGAIISFELKDAAAVPAVLEKVKVFSFAESLGGTESLITFPKVQTHADMGEAILERLGINGRLLRLSIGLETAEDLIADLEQALE
jgi:cystathionine gamma-synthase/cystathionine beta-lyase